MTNSTRTLVFTGPGFNLDNVGLPDPDSPISYYDKHGNCIHVTLKEVRCKMTVLLESGWAVITSNRSGASYGVYVGKLKR